MDWLGALLAAITLGATFIQVRTMLRDAMVANGPTPRMKKITRFGKMYFAGVGAVIIGVGLTLATRKLLQIRKWNLSTGIVTYVQTSSHSIAPYSFYVRFRAGKEELDHFAYTSTPFRRREGDRVTVIYAPEHPDRPELLMLDSDWIGFGMICLAGIGIVALGFWLLYWPSALVASRREGGNG